MAPDANHISKEEKHDFAVHEASHAVISYQLGMIFIKTSLKDLDPMYGGNTYYGKGQRQYSGNMSPEDAERDRVKWAKIGLAGPLGEKEYNPKSNWKIHGGCDFTNAKEQIVSAYKLFPEDPEIIKEAEEKIKPIKREVERMIVQHKNLILRVAEKLSRVGELSYADVENIITETIK